jgi:hypothetical protein
MFYGYGNPYLDARLQASNDVATQAHLTDTWFTLTSGKLSEKGRPYNSADFRKQSNDLPALFHQKSEATVRIYRAVKEFLYSKCEKNL